MITLNKLVSDYVHLGNHKNWLCSELVTQIMLGAFHQTNQKDSLNKHSDCIHVLYIKKTGFGGRGIFFPIQNENYIKIQFFM